MRLLPAKRFPLLLAVLCSLFVACGCGKKEKHPHPPLRVLPEADIPKPEHPRPDFQRDRWKNLNGDWSFVIDPDNRGEAEEWFLPGRPVYDRTIRVPFPWESPASGLDRDMQYYTGLAWYRKAFSVPGSWAGSRVLVRFGAVDWSCRVWLNGRFLGEHEGGYTPFSFDATHLLRAGENILAVRVWDPSDTDPQILRGKQGGMWYARASGIWQTVYLEAVPSIHLETVHITPQPWDSTALVRLRLSSPATRSNLSIRFRLENPSGEKKDLVFPWANTAESTEGEFLLPLDKQRLWSPEDPALYGLRICLSPDQGEEDWVETYFGQRSVRTDWAPGHSPTEQDDPQEQYQYIYLNDKPVFIRGLLDQSYHPEGIYTYPDEEALKRDLLLAKEMGFNFLRIHIKIDEPRRLYWADRMGLLLMADIPCMDWFAVNTANSRCRPLWEQVMRGAVARDFNHPSLIAWCDFNETWGLTLPLPLLINPDLQDWVHRMWDLTRELDPTRLVEDNSPTDLFQDHVITDINSWHFYMDDYYQVKAHLDRMDRETYPGSGAYYAGGNLQDGAPLLCSEYGPVSAIGGDRDVSWGFKYQTNELRRHPKINGYVYTELTDVEWEHNGLLRYDRSRKESGYEDGGITIRDLTGDDFLVLHGPPALQLEPGAELCLDVSVSFFSSPQVPPDAELYWRFFGTDDLGQPVEGPEGGPLPICMVPYGMSETVTIRQQMPGETAAGAIRIWAESAGSEWRIANYLPVELYSGQKPREESMADGSWILRWDPGENRRGSWTGGPVQIAFADEGLRVETVAGFESGFMEYRIPLPQGLEIQNMESVEFMVEASAAAGIFNLQTDEDKTPSPLTMRLNGIALDEVVMPDAPADSRGFLSYLHAGFPPLYGSYGYLLSAELSGEELPPLKESLNNERAFIVRLEVADSEGDQANGLRVYGDRLGRYAVDPCLLIRMRQ